VRVLDKNLFILFMLEKEIKVLEIDKEAVIKKLLEL
jgi:hypothetical protein